MTWELFFKWTISLYILYYLVNIVFDFLRSKKGNVQTEGDQVYNFSDLELEEDVHNVDIDDQQFISSSSSNGQSSSFSEVNGSDHEINVLDKSTIETQGIPVDEFIANARNYSKQISFN